MALINTNTTGNYGTAYAGDSSGVLTVQQDGVTIAKITSAPAFIAYKPTGSQSVTSSTSTKVTYTTELYDTNNNYDASTSRFQPSVAGFYQISAEYSTSGTSSQTRAIIMLFKNGTEYCTLQDLTVTSYRYGGSQLVYLNGSTDYVEVYAYINGTSPVIEGGTGGVIGYNSMWSGFLARAA